MSTPAEQMNPGETQTPETPTSEASAAAPEPSPAEPTHDSASTDGTEHIIEGQMSQILDEFEAEEAGKSESVEAPSDAGDEPPAELEAPEEDSRLEAPAETPKFEESEKPAEEPAAEAKPEEAKQEPETPPEEPESEPEPPPETPEEREARLKAEREQYLAVRQEQYDNLLTHYEGKITEEDLREFQDAPEKAIPKFMASVYLDAVEGATNSVLKAVPQVIAGMNQQVSREQKAEKKFFGAFPALKDKVPYEEMTATAQQLRQLKPNATLDELIKEVGVTLSVIHRIPIPEILEQEQAAAEAAQVGDVIRTPHNPAQTKTGETPAATRKKTEDEGNQFVQLAEEFIEDDRDL